MGLKRSPEPRVPEGWQIYAVGDIHGRADLLRDLHQKIAGDAATAGAVRNVVVYLGDYIDRGPASREVVDILIEQPLAGFEAIHLRGNHEDFLLRFLEDSSVGRTWMFNGGRATLESYGIRGARIGLGTVVERSMEKDRRDLIEELPRPHLDYLRSLRSHYVAGDYFFVHAGIRPGIPLDAQSPHDMMWIRDEFLGSTADHGKTVVHGHSIAWDEPEVRPNRIGIDTGAFASGRLTALVLAGSKHRFLSTAG